MALKSTCKKKMHSSLILSRVIMGSLIYYVCMRAQSCLTLCGPMDCSLPSSSVSGISQQEFWRGFSFPAPGYLPDPGTEPVSLVPPAQVGRFFTTTPPLFRCFLVTQTVKNLPAMQEAWVGSLGWEDPWRRKWLPTPIFTPGEFHGLRSLEGFIPQGRKRSNTAEQHTHTPSQTHTPLCITVMA